MRIHHEPHVDTTVLDAAALLAMAMGDSLSRTAASLRRTPTAYPETAPVGAWRTPDGTVRLDIRTDGTYDGQVAGRKRRAHGTYLFDGSTMMLSDDSGLNTSVTVFDGGLEMAGHRLGRA
ncbi:Atu4866 domain-containing protein [Paractinoplanes rishiriensis]|uniref:Uncharacterized protein n=1 Tax=Paractinoplanes rishiriensis TaxID=1050105 RepID=A0A919JZY5_9ACTN|nr:Atu4866 domain-containing protein [Actinoplanes rishiriensis]GIE98341.1 hypothetical protein Ari01nite_58060 [Actinoplanes rishiriensis]